MTASAGGTANGEAFLYAFDLIELNGNDLRRNPVEVRKATLASVPANVGAGVRTVRGEPLPALGAKRQIVD